MKLAITCIAVMWLICGWTAFGITNAYYRATWSAINDLEARQNCAAGVFVGLLGPLGFGLAFLHTGFAYYGFSSSCSVKELSHEQER